MSNTLHADVGGAECTDCPLSGGRRAFLKQAGLASMGMLIMVGMPPGLAAAALPTVIAPTDRAGSNPVYPIPAKDGVQIDKENDVILVRWQNAVYAFNLSCPHQNTALRWDEADAQFQCPKHHSKYKPDGTFISGRATRSMDRFSVARQGDQIVVNVDAMHKNDVDPAGWNSSVILLATGA
jgi:nitrite reductase/ring-hydroxylating ferredoxin subunit